MITSASQQKMPNAHQYWLLCIDVNIFAISLCHKEAVKTQLTELIDIQSPHKTGLDSYQFRHDLIEINLWLL